MHLCNKISIDSTHCIEISPILQNFPELLQNQNNLQLWSDTMKKTLLRSAE